MIRKRAVAAVVIIIILALVVVSGIIWIRYGHSNGVPPNTADQGRIKFWDDGTAYVTGEVIGQIHGCEVDGMCALVVRAQGQNIELVYAAGMAIPSTGRCTNFQAAEWIGKNGNGKIGAIVQAYGAMGKPSSPYGQYSISDSMDFCGSPNYFILGENDPVPQSASSAMVSSTNQELLNTNSANGNAIKLGIDAESTTSAPLSTSTASVKISSCTLLPYTGNMPLSALSYTSTLPDGSVTSTPITYPGEPDVRGGMICKFSIAQNLPIFTFHFIGDQKWNTLNPIEVAEGSSTNVIQTLDLTADNSGGPGSLGLEPDPIQSVENAVGTVDANFDGYQDLRVVTQVSATANVIASFYLYDPATNRFIYNSFLSNLPAPSFNADTKSVGTFWHIGPGSNDEEGEYQYQNGQYVLTKKTVHSTSSGGIDGSVTTQEYKLINGNMQLISSTTTP